MREMNQKLLQGHCPNPGNRIQLWRIGVWGAMFHHAVPWQSLKIIGALTYFTTLHTCTQIPYNTTFTCWWIQQTVSAAPPQIQHIWYLAPPAFHIFPAEVASPFLVGQRWLLMWKAVDCCQNCRLCRSLCPPRWHQWCCGVLSLVECHQRQHRRPFWWRLLLGQA